MPHDRETNETHGRLIDCFCPRCRQVHKMKMLWIGRGVPKKYCSICRDIVADVDPVHAVEYHRPRMFPGFVPGN